MLHNPRMPSFTDVNLDISAPKKEKPADWCPDWLSQQLPRSQVIKSPKLHIWVTEPGTLSQGSHPLQGFSKSAFGFISVTGLNFFFLPRDKNPIFVSNKRTSQFYGAVASQLLQAPLAREEPLEFTPLFTGSLRKLISHQGEHQCLLFFPL